jgi:competence protein ComEA
LDQSTPAWRIFDEPAGPQGAAVPGRTPGTTPSGVAPDGAVALASPNVLLAAAAIIGAILIGGVALVVAMSGSGGATIEGPGTVLGSPAPESPTPAFGEIVVDVTGAVAKPGLYHLATGARVGDAIDAAGGFGPRVDVDRVARELNLAATLQDGDQVRVPSRDDPTSPPGGGGSGGSGGGGGGGSGGSGGGLVNLNTASQAELEELPGIGPVTAEKIIAAREEAPFRTVEELRERGLVGEKTFEDLRALVTTG